MCLFFANSRLILPDPGDELPIRYSTEDPEQIYIRKHSKSMFWAVISVSWTIAVAVVLWHFLTRNF